MKRTALKRRTPLRAKKPFRRKPKPCSGMGGSLLQSAVYELLKARQDAGEIRDLAQQVSVELLPGETWTVDFSYVVVATGLTEWAEAKGVGSYKYRINRKLWKAGRGPGRLVIWKGDWRGPRIAEVIEPEEIT